LKKSVWRVILVSIALLGGVAFMFTLLSPKKKQIEFEQDPNLPELVNVDLDSIRSRGKLIILTENSSSTYYLYKEEPKGFDYELAKQFAKFLKVKLEVRVIENLDSMFAMLYRGEGDIIASNLTITEQRKRFLAFSPPIYQTKQVLVQRRDTSNKLLENGIVVHGINELDRLPIHVHAYSSFYRKLEEITKNTGLSLQVIEASGKVGTEELLQEVASGAVPATITDKSLAFLSFEDYPNLDMSVELSEDEDIGWAVRPNAYLLQERLSAFIAGKSGARFISKLYRRYFGRAEENWSGGVQRFFSMPPIQAGALSPFDSLYKVHAPIVGWDWRLLTALSFVESGFNPNAESWAGARGLMQLMPATIMKYDGDTLCPPDNNIQSGAKYLHSLDNFWAQRIRNPEERIKFILASYNCGPGHILDAMCIAKQIGRNDTLWEGHVADALMLKAQRQYYAMSCVKHGYLNGVGPVNFVNKILAIFEHYKLSTK
jgi:membrane-bound lytic murein transglycosylase F